VAVFWGSSTGFAQTQPSAVAPSVLAPSGQLNLAAGLAGRTVEKIEVRGNQEVASTAVLNVIRTRVGQPLDPVTVQEDYQRIYELRRFSNVEAQVQPTDTGVIVAFIVSEQKAIKSVSFVGNKAIDTTTLSNSITVRANESIDNFRIALARRAIEQMYKSKNYPLTSVSVDADAMAKDGRLVFQINEGPNVRIRNIDFIGNTSFNEDRLKSKIQSRAWVWIARAGTLDEDLLEDDVAALREYYRSKGFFDARVGRRVLFSPDQTEAQVEFVIDEGPRYVVETITFVGNNSLTEAQLRDGLKLTEGKPFDQELVERDVRRLVDLFAPLGFIYEPGSPDPDYLTIVPEQRFRLEPGTIELVYRIGEGKPFELGNIEVRGNTRTQDKVVLREFRKLSPGQLFNATAIREASERLRGIGLFDRVKVTPVGNDPNTRDLLVETQEAKTATLTFGAGINSNGGLSGNVTYTQRNFDASNFPTSLREVFDEQAFVGAGQSFRMSFEPGTEVTNASIRLTEPFLFDQPYSLTQEGFLRDRRREDYRDGRLGGRVSLGHRFTDEWSAAVGLRGETVDINDINDEPARAFEILDEQGSHLLTNPGPLPHRGTNTQATWESFGALGGDYSFQKFTASFDWYHTLRDDLLDRKTVLAFHLDGGYITGDSVFFERFYGGGIGSVRGFAFRGISPRSGPDDDRVGGEFSATGSLELSFPVAGDQLRGVVFGDFGTVEDEFTLGTIRSSVGAGVRITLPIIGQVPIAIDVAYPLTKDDDDDTQIISFSLGFTP
jgi:outer membrane protein insertion porin family